MKTVSMKAVMRAAGALGVALALMVMAGCTTFSSIGGTADAHGLISSGNMAASGSEVIGSYGVILGLLDSGYEAYVSAVNAAEAAGKVVSTTTTWYLGFYTKVTAYAK